MLQSNVTSKGQVTIPASIRKQLGIKPGGRVVFRLRGNETVLAAVNDPPLSTLFGIVKVPKGRGIKNLDKAIAEAAGEEYEASLK